LTDAESSFGTRILTGEDRELRLLAARGVLPVPPEELIRLQVALARGDDPEIAAEAAGSLRALTPRLANNYLERSAGDDELTYFALEIGHPRMIDTVLRRRDVPRSLLQELAPRLSEDLQEALLLRQDAIVELPEILSALDANPRLTAFARRRIHEYREHLLPRQRRRAAANEGEADGLDPDEATDEEARRAIAEVRRSEEATEDADVDDATGLTEAQIRMLALPVRLHLARGAKRQLRSFLLRDPNPRVAVAVMRFNLFSDQEVEQIASSRLVTDEVFAEILRRKDWVRKYPIVRALVFNPGVPVAVGVRLVPRLSVRDLRVLSRERNVADPVRTMAQRLYTIKRR
jgi:hypothetical protein